MSISDNINKLKNSIPETVKLVAVSKTKTIKEILQAYSNKHYDFGENKVQELVKKAEFLPKNINWHMIGHLQSNKVKYIAPFVHLIHTVDSLKLLKEIDKRAAQNERIIDCLIQVHIAQEDTKFGFNIENVKHIIEDSKKYKNIKIKGLMGMASFTDNKKQIEKEFHQLKNLFDSIDNEKINILSMGMSSDYKVAILKGSNLIRLGSAIFGNRK